MYKSRLLIIDITDPANPKIKSMVLIPTNATDPYSDEVQKGGISCISVSSNFRQIYAADMASGLHLIELTPEYILYP